MLQREYEEFILEWSETAFDETIVNITYNEDNTSFIGYYFGTGQSIAAATDELRPSEFFGRQLATNAERLGT